jgi:hypothetical protein
VTRTYVLYIQVEDGATWTVKIVPVELSEFRSPWPDSVYLFPPDLVARDRERWGDTNS